MTRRNCYLLLYNHAFGSYEEVKAMLDSWPDDILNWHSLFAGTFFIISEKSATDLTTMIYNVKKKQGLQGLLHNGTDVRFAICPFEIDAVNGWMPRFTWDFVSFRKSAEEEIEDADNPPHVAGPMERQKTSQVG